MTFPLPDIDASAAGSHGDVVSTDDVVRVLELSVRLQILDSDCVVDLNNRPGKR